MAWTDPPRTWTTGELVTSTIMNTHVRDQLIYLKQNPVISETTISGNQITSGATPLTVATVSDVVIPADVGAVFVEFWAVAFGFQSAAPGSSADFVSGRFAIGDSVAGGIIDTFHGQDHVTTGTKSWVPLYVRSADYAWGGTTRTFTAILYGSWGNGFIKADELAARLRVVRSY